MDDVADNPGVWAKDCNVDGDKNKNCRQSHPKPPNVGAKGNNNCDNFHVGDCHKRLFATNKQCGKHCRDGDVECGICAFHSWLVFNIV